MSASGIAGIKRRRNYGAVFERAMAYLLIAVLAAWLLINFMQDPAVFATVFMDGLRMGSLYALIALGYTMVYGIIQLINFAHGDLFMLGTLFSATFLTTLYSVIGQPMSEIGTAGTSTVMGIATVVLAMFATAAFCGLINVTVERFAYRRLRTAPKLAPLITAIGVSFVFQFIGLMWNGSGQRNWTPVLPSGAIDISGVIIKVNTAVVLLLMIPLLIGLTYLVKRTRSGRAMRATAQDQDAARLMGINVNRTISFTFLLGGSLAGIAGVIFQQMVATTRFDLGLRMGLYAFTAAVLGGIGNLSGAVLGGVLIGLITELNAGLPFGLTQRWGQSVVFVILILLMVFKPEGLLGKPTTEKV